MDVPVLIVFLRTLRFKEVFLEKTADFGYDSSRS